MASHPPSPSDAEPKTGSETVIQKDIWDTIAAMPEFTALTRRKARFIIASTIFFLIYYFALLVLVGYHPQLMQKNIGPVNIAYLFALSQFIMAWVVAVLYTKVAAGWDAASSSIIAKAHKE